MMCVDVQMRESVKKIKYYSYSVSSSDFFPIHFFINAVSHSHGSVVVEYNSSEVVQTIRLDSAPCGDW